ncbi:MAG: LppX_LprAFG lipoprotein [Chloroflexi bacterium]|nr:LppX_LprAFG lipoprotein [Chloroflexota bacterium]
MITVRPGLRARQIPNALVLVAAITVAVAVAAGCSKTPVPEPPVESRSVEPVAPTITAPEAVAESRNAMANLDNFRFELTHDSGFTSLSGGLELIRAEGLVTQKGLDLEAEAKLGRAFVRVEAVVIDDRTWMTNPLTGAWSEIPPEDSPFSFLDPVKLVADILGDTREATYYEKPRADADLTITGRIPATTLAALVGTVDPDAVPAVTLTLSAGTYLLKKIVVVGVTQPDDDENTTRVISLSEFDNPVSLKPPI